MNFELKLTQIRSYFYDIKNGSDAGGGTSALSQVTSAEQKSVAMNLNSKSDSSKFKQSNKSKEANLKNNNFSKQLRLLSLLFILFKNLSPNCALAETIVMKADRWCPFNCDPTSLNSTNNGFVVDVAKAVFERRGHNVVYEIDSWSSSIKSVRNGPVTALLTTTKADAPDFIYPLKSIGSNKECFYVNVSDTWEFNSVVDLKNRKVGLVDAFAYSGELTSFIVENPKAIFKATGSNPLEMNLNNLQSKKIDTIIENPFVFNYFTEKKKKRELFADAGCTIGDDLYIGFSPKNPRSKEFAKILSEGILELRKDGTLDKIINKYSLKEWSP